MAKKKSSTPIEAVKHSKETRTNIPTREQGALIADDEAAPRKVFYPRDPSLDPQLVWKGKDEQDQKPLEVPAVPIYIQEKIHPQALIEDLRARAAAAKPHLLDLYADFNGAEGGALDHAKRTEFYQHDKHWTNRLILGDSLLVLTSLAEKERLKGRVQMIYLDPPLRHQVRLQLAGLDQETRRQGRQGDRPHPPARAGQSLPRHLAARHPLLLDLPPRPSHHPYVAEQWGRRWITIDTSRVALALARTRLMAARYPYYLLADWPAGRHKEAEVSGGVHPRRAGDDGGDEPRPAEDGGDKPRRSEYDIRKGLSTSGCRTSRSRASPTTRTSRRA